MGKISNKKKCLTILVMLFFIVAKAQVPLFNSVTPNNTIVAKYEKFELAINLTAGYTNPYDYDDIALRGVFVAPSGRRDTVDGFYADDFTLNTSTGGLTATGTGGFKVRYSPNETGSWQYILYCSNTAGTTIQTVQNFTCTSSAGKGFIRKNNTNYFNFDNGEQYFAIGENLAWQSSNIYADYKSWTQKLSDNKANYFRLWLADWGLGLEWKNGTNGYNGLKKYKQSNSYYLDWLMDECKSKGIYIMFCINHHGQVSTTTNAEWSFNPYNNANGGPCTNTWDFFSNATAKNMHKNRLRYILARWGYSQNILCWELFNEVEWTDNFSTYKTSIKDWHQEMAAYLKTKDVYKHLVTTSYANDVNDPDTWNLADVDFTQTHYYNGSPNVETVLTSGVQSYLTQFNKPTINGEFGLNATTSSLSTIDPNGIHIHNSIWATAFSGAFGSAMSWWWDSYIDPQNLYTQFKPLGTFISTIALKDDNYKKTTAAITGGGNADLTVSPGADWGLSPASSFTINTDGSVSPAVTQMSRYLYGSTWNTGLRNPPVFSVTYPVSGQFKVVTGSGTGTSPKITIYVDGVLVLDQAASVNSTYTVNITAGTHTIKADNSGTDWILVSQFVFTNISTPINAYILKSTDNSKACGWIHNKLYNWQYLKDNGTAPAAVSGASLTIPGMQNGTYTIQFTDCSTGLVSSTANATATGNNLVIALPVVAWDYAITAIPATTTPVNDLSKERMLKIYPNPVKHGKMFLIYTLISPAEVTVELYDISGKKIETFYNGKQTTGIKNIQWNCGDIPAGLYFVRLTTGKNNDTIKIIVQ